jgi:hypothetical protein
MHAVVATDLPETDAFQLENNNSDPDLDDFQLDVVYVLVGCVLAYVMATR